MDSARDFYLLGESVPQVRVKKEWGGCTFQAEDLDCPLGHESEDVDKRLVTRDWIESTSYVIHTNQFSKTELEQRPDRRPAVSHAVPSMRRFGVGLGMLG